jgi:hypothetical protein
VISQACFEISRLGVAEGIGTVAPKWRLVIQTLDGRTGDDKRRIRINQFSCVESEPNHCVQIGLPENKVKIQGNSDHSIAMDTGLKHFIELEVSHLSGRFATRLNSLKWGSAESLSSGGFGHIGAFLINIEESWPSSGLWGRRALPSHVRPQSSVE